MPEEKQLTGYPSIDKPWLKYYSEEAIHAPLPECTIYEYLWENNKDHLDDVALNYFDRKITFGETPTGQPGGRPSLPYTTMYTLPSRTMGIFTLCWP